MVFERPKYFWCQGSSCNLFSIAMEQEQGCKYSSQNLHGQMMEPVSMLITTFRVVSGSGPQLMIFITSALANADSDDGFLKIIPS